MSGRNRGTSGTVSATRDQLVSGALGPRHVLRQQDGCRPDRERNGIDAGRWSAVPAECRRGILQELSDADDAAVRLAQALARAIEDRPLTLGDGLVLRAHTRDAEELVPLVRVPVDQVFVALVRARTDV